MDCGKKKKLHKLKITEDGEEEDRISKLSDDLIHEIMLFLNTRLAVQTSILSKRWKFVWKTLPYLNFHRGYHQHSKFINYVLTKRNHEFQLRKLDLSAGLPVTCMRRYIKYAISHNVETLHVDLDRCCVLSMFDSSSLKDLKLTMPFEYISDVMESECWRLPNLTTLYLKQSIPTRKYRVKYRDSLGRFPQSCLICLSVLTTLRLKKCALPEFFSLPCLTTLYLVNCTLPETIWELPALLTLEIDVEFRKNLSEYFLALANLRNLAIDFSRCGMTDCVIPGYQLVNLKIRASHSIVNGSETKFVVSAPKLCNFTAIGFFPITFEGCELENVEIEFFKSYLYRVVGKKKILEYKRDLFNMMFAQLGSAKNLTLDFETLEELSSISDLLVHLERPFYSLKHLKLPLGCKASSISSIVRRYLLGASPKATIVEKLGASSQVNVIPQITPVVSTSAQNVATRNKKKIKSQNVHKSTRLPKEHN